MKNIDIKKIIIYILFICLFSCGKSLVQQFGMVETRIQGEWELVSYTINDVELIDSRNFYFTKLKIDKVRINYTNKLQAFPTDCSLCLEDVSFNVKLNYENSNSTNVKFISVYLEGNIDSVLSTTSDNINLFYYNSQMDTIHPFAVYGYYWRIEKLSSSVLILNNGVGGPFNEENVKITFEKY